MSRYTALFLLALLAFRSTGYLAFSLTRLHSGRVRAQEAWQHSAPGELERFVFPISQYEALARGEREFWLGGRLYDIVHAARQRDSIYLQATPDRFEQDLVRQVIALFQNKQPVSSPLNASASWWGHWFAQVFLPPAERPALFAVPQPDAQQAPRSRERIPAGIPPGCATPPPETDTVSV